MKFSIVAAAAMVLAPELAASLSVASAAESALRSARDRAQKALAAGVVTPLRLNQKLLLCNAYPGDMPISASLNGKDVFGSSEAKGAIAFQKCQYITSHVQKQDRLDFDIGDAEVHGTFEVGDLPVTDAVLLLVLQKREGSSMIGFQSFAFPSAAGREDAQLAVINTFKGNTTDPRLAMEDHLAPVGGKDKSAVARRTEQLNFNRVYSVEAGTYDTAIIDEPNEASGNKRSASRSLTFAKGTNYVLLRTPSGDAGETLTVFPDAPLQHSSAVRLAAFPSMLMALCAAALGAIH
mmetsp:Transcript_108679/g.313852  ORF Transcript_108679/g.313852 Transcript_108679/m.313852 type:complete len:293 (+) Transcript_108679:66-944(+)|eukprot:CAMPEP_0176056458 /NCGR_PEP_ID=MMETSP0120_2-20121206/28115_1 /TAXON_ID=160619 /ORGANISM="Kryptoperidinium foliaceum, Strain CCMP 1326" /LENGTH=292 /DNA_ID=CAMNT_0017389963 /DNA_START=58 /DNA_END=936 /DNA_ORIENTATION=-